MRGGMSISAAAVARLLGTTERQVYRWVDDGEIPHRRVRDQLGFDRTDLLEWATSRGLPVHVEAFEDDQDERAPSLAEAVRLGGVHVDVGGHDRDSVVREVVACVPIPEHVDPELLIEVILARENSGSTAVGGGVAIPHVRNPIIAAGAPARVTVCYLTRPLAMGAPDGEPVTTLLVAVTPTVRTHLQLLARLARALTDPGFAAALHRRAPLDELAGEAARIEGSAAPR